MTRILTDKERATLARRVPDPDAWWEHAQAFGLRKDAANRAVNASTHRALLEQAEALLAAADAAGNPSAADVDRSAAADESAKAEELEASSARLAAGGDKRAAVVLGERALNHRAAAAAHRKRAESKQSGAFGRALRTRAAATSELAAAHAFPDGTWAEAALAAKLAKA